MKRGVYVAMPIVFPVTGNELKKNGGIPDSTSSAATAFRPTMKRLWRT